MKSELWCDPLTCVDFTPWLILPIYAVLLGSVALWWDLRRRELTLREKQPDPETVEKFEIQRLAEVGAAVNELQLTISGVLDTVHQELEDARSERRKAVSAKAGSTPKTPRVPTPPEGEDVPLEQLPRAAQLARIEARYN